MKDDIEPRKIESVEGGDKEIYVNEDPKKPVKNDKKTTKKLIKTENKQLRNILIGLGIIIILFVAGYFYIDSIRNIEYEGVKFTTIKEEGFGEEGYLILYNAKIPFYNEDGEHYRNHNVYLRNNPNDLKKIEFEGELIIKENMVINSEEEFKCEGYGNLAVANLADIYNVIGTKVIKDESATCDEQGRYMYLNLKRGNENRIEKYGPVCYNIIIKDCEVLKSTERFMIETLAKITS